MRKGVRAAGLCALLLSFHNFAAAADCPPAVKPFTPELFSAAAKNPRDRGLLWSIAKDDRVSYLYGTFHLGREAWMAPGPRASQALRETEVIALELDPLDPQMQRELAEAAGQAHKDLPASLKARLQAALDAECLRLGPLEASPPEFQVMALMFSAGRRDGLESSYGSEILLSLIGRGLERPVISLENARLQVGVMLGETEAETALFVEESLNDIAKGKTRKVIIKTAEIWEQGDLAVLERYADWCECVDTEIERKFMKRALDERNPALADGIDQLHRQGKKVFAAVGALHMVGPQGLPALLASRGYQVRRLR